MIPVDATYQDILNNGGQYEWQIVNGANTFTKANIISGTITSTLHEQLSVGNVIASQLELELRDVTVDTDSMLQVQFRATDGTNNSNWIIKGEFFIDTLETSPYSEITKITAFDALLKTETDFMPTGSYVPMTALETVEMIADDIGVPLDNDTKNLLEQNPVTLTNAPNVGVGGTTDREMLSYIATIYGGNWVIKWGYYTTIISGTTYIVAGETLMLVLPYNTPANMADVGDAVVTFDASEVETVKRIKLWLNYETYYLAPTGYTEEQWLALGGRCIEAQLPFYATQAIATNLLSHFNNISFYPYAANEVYLDPKYEVGDRVKFKTTNSVTSVIASQTITLNPLAPSNLEFRQEDKVNSLYPYISSVQRNTIYQVTQAAEAAASAEAAVGNANYKEQTIYISKASGTSSVSANTTWVTDSSGNQNTWTTTRPVYSSSYPVLFVATQRQSVSQSSGTTCTCTTPVKDQTTTVIDGGHITTGTIDASVVNVTNINASNIETGTLTGVTISGNTISGNTISGGTISGTTITGSTLTSATASGSVQIENGNINFFKNATTTGTPFAQIKHTIDGTQGDSIEWANSGYTKLVNTGGGQWTADFVQFALGASNPSMQMQIYSGSDGTHTKVLSDWFDVQGTYTGQTIGSTSDYDRYVVGLCKSYNGANNSWWSGRIFHNRENGVIAPFYADVMAHNAYMQGGSGWLNLRTSHRNYAASKTGDSQGWQPCTFVYNGETYTGIEGYFLQAANIIAIGGGSTKPIAIPYYDTQSGVLNSEVYNSINFAGAYAFGDEINGGRSESLVHNVGTTETLITSKAGEYSAFIVYGVPSSNYTSSCFVPKSALSSSASNWQLSDEDHYIGFTLRLDGNNLYAKVAATNNGTKTINVHGLR